MRLIITKVYLYLWDLTKDSSFFEDLDLIFKQILTQIFEKQGVP